MNSPEKFRIPKLQFQANDQELSSLRKKMLAHHYDRQIYQHKSQQNRIETGTTGRKSIRTQHNPQQPQWMPNYIDYNNMWIDRERIAKQQLAKYYQNQIATKLRIQKLQKQTKLDEQKQMIQNLLSQAKKIQQQQRQAQLNYRKELFQQVQQHKNHEKQIRNKQMEDYRKKYTSVSQLPIHRNLAFHENSKLNKFKQHFDNVNHFQSQIGNNYVKNWTPIIKEKQYEKQRLIQQGISKAHGYEKIMAVRKEQIQNKFKSQFKQALEKQIKQKQQGKIRQKARHKQETYTPNSLKNLHHPICNPVDFKMAHDNKRILKQLKQEQQFENRKSGLARHGSVVVMQSYATQ